MTDFDRKIKQFNTRATFELKQIERYCQEVMNMSRQIKNVAVTISEQEMSVKKMEILKSQIKDKLKQFANYIDEIYKIIDRKVMLIIAEVGKQHMNSTGKFLPKEQTDKQSRIKELEHQLNAHIKRQNVFAQRINELRAKNERLIEQFNTLSQASNRRISQLSQEIAVSNHKSALKKQNSMNSNRQSPFKGMNMGKNNNKIIGPYLSGLSDDNSYNYSSSSDYYILNQSREEVKPKILSFGCMPSDNSKTRLVLDKIGPNIQVTEEVNKNDKLRRFDLLLNKLRDSQQPSTEMSVTNEDSKGSVQQVSALSKNVVKRYQI